ncbi:MAG: hypothetical protein QNK31_02810 [Porticoccus sp.]|nr:hypothetical protein [Porticoccus sp.]
MTANKVTTLKLFGGLALLVLSMESIAFGTLFTSPQQRDALDQQRANGGGAEIQQSLPQQELSPTVTPPAKQVFFNGYVIRKSGPGTAWANHHVVTDHNTQQNGITARLKNIKGSSVPVKPSALSKSIRLQPGQLLNQDTGEITESYYQKYSTTQPNHSVKPEQEAEEPENDSLERE